MARWPAGEVPVTFVAFDLLHIDGHDLTGRPLMERKELLDELQLAGPAWATNGWHPGEGETAFEVCVELGR
jgi:bifunctional non-homologous end joining protein LigD